MFQPIGEPHPRVLRFFEYGHGWRGKVWISERADRNDIPARPDIGLPIQGCPTVRAKIESNLATCLPVSLEDLAEPFDPDLCRREGRATPCWCPGSTLAGLAVTHIDQ